MVRKEVAEDEDVVARPLDLLSKCCSELLCRAVALVWWWRAPPAPPGQVGVPLALQARRDRAAFQGVAARPVSTSR